MQEIDFASDSPFPVTRWSLVARAGGLTDQHARKALDELIGGYAELLRDHLVICRGIPRQSAEDMLHDFVVEKLLERNIISLADPIRGRFRNFLLTTLDRFAIDAQRRQKAAKRDPRNSGAVVLDIAEHADQLRDRSPSPAEAFDLAWARHVLNETTMRMRSQCAESGRPQIWGLFDDRVLKPATEGMRPRAMSELVRQYRLESPASASNQLSTAKRMFSRIFRLVIREYTANEAELDAEVRELWQIVSSARQIAPGNP